MPEGFTNVRLSTRDGLFVTSFEMSTQGRRPDVVQWDERFFRWYALHEYRECFGCIVPVGTDEEPTR